MYLNKLKTYSKMHLYPTPKTGLYKHYYTSELKAIEKYYRPDR